MECECCCICLEGLNSRSMQFRLRCSHTFHYMCISKWINTGGGICPLCNASINKELFILQMHSDFYECHKHVQYFKKYARSLKCKLRMLKFKLFWRESNSNKILLGEVYYEYVNVKAFYYKKNNELRILTENLMCYPEYLNESYL